MFSPGPSVQKPEPTADAGECGDEKAATFWAFFGFFRIGERFAFRSSFGLRKRSNHEYFVLVQDLSDPSIAPPQAKMTDHGEIIVRGVRLKNTHFDYPVTVNSRVEHWIDYFTGKGRKHFDRYLQRSEFFIPYIAPLLKQNGLPEDLVYLAMIESGFNNHAKSHARAVGPWQFISATGRRYGLSVNWWIDERRDIYKSTLGAVGYLRDLYSIFGSWELAAAAYNSGEAKIARGVRRYGTRDFWVLSQHRFLRPETRDYVPKIIAAALISKNRVQFGFPESYHAKPGDDEAVAPDGELVKLIKSDRPTDGGEVDTKDYSGDEESAEEGGITPATLTVPEGSGTRNEGTVAKMDPIPSGPLARPIPTPHVTRNGKVGGEDLAEFEVQSPADLLKVSRAAGLSYQTVKGLNPELLRWCTPPTEKSYRLKLPAFVKARFLETYNHISFPKKVDFMAYRVRRGETIARIARHFGIKADPIAELNRVSVKTALAAGIKLLLPMPNDRSRTMASLEVRDPPEKRRARRHRRSRSYKVSYRERHAARSTRSSGT